MDFQTQFKLKDHTVPPTHQGRGVRTWARISKGRSSSVRLSSVVRAKPTRSFLNSQNAASTDSGTSVPKQSQPPWMVRPTSRHTPRANAPASAQLSVHKEVRHVRFHSGLRTVQAICDLLHLRPLFSRTISHVRSYGSVKAGDPVRAASLQCEYYVPKLQAPYHSDRAIAHGTRQN